MLGVGGWCMKMSHKILPNYHNNLIIFIELSFMSFLSSFIQDTNTQMHATTGHSVHVSTQNISACTEIPQNIYNGI